ncbi:MAG: flagellar biosynthesis protein FliQ [Alphaproteobacteria bacterium]|nr:flagellar biosynthesis protein FliQ [Alphaproteobacteria bacterium]
MNAAMIGDLLREAVFVMLKVSGPLMLIGLVIGVIVSLLQALTQIQEQSLTFVPKLFALLFSMIFLGSFMLRTLIQFTEQLFSRIAT